jgi:formylglycine-generating enzyme required for sulfatase activity
MFEKTLFRLSVVVAALTVMAFASVARADSFGTGGNQFTIDFVPISASTNPTDAQTIAGDLDGFGIVNNNYRMGMYEITNDQWNKFVAIDGTPNGYPSTAYDSSASYTSTNVPIDSVSWYEAAQMVNWLNTSTDHLPAYKFTGTPGELDYALATWSEAEAAGGTNLYRHKDAFYFLPSEDEWVKAAYWNGTTLQDYATKGDGLPFQGDVTSGTGWNYYDAGYATDPSGPWDVGSGSEELNGTFDMMGNNWEWMESPWDDPGVTSQKPRGIGLS